MMTRPARDRPRRIPVACIALFWLAVGASPALAGPVTEHILGGTPATIGEYPTVVVLQVGNGLCTGTIITKDWVLTAAHCLTPSVVGLTTQAQVTQSVRVHVGTVNIAMASGTTLTASDTIPDPMFNIAALGRYDSGLIKLSSSYTAVTPVRLNFEAAGAPVGVTGTMVGFGATAAGGHGTVGVEYVVSQTSIACGAGMGSDANLLCFNQVDGKGKCEGDSGGPTFATVDGKLVQVGITSFGDQDCSMFGADTRIDAERPFILGHVPDLECSSDADCGTEHECFQHACIITPFQPSGLGSTCTSNGDCASNECARGTDGTKCTQSCTSGSADACPSGFDCIESTGTQRVCWANSGGCCDAGGGGAPSIALGAGVLVLLRRRRRERHA